MIVSWHLVFVLLLRSRPAYSGCLWCRLVIVIFVVTRKSPRVGPAAVSKWVSVDFSHPLPSNQHQQSSGDCLEAKGGGIIRYVLCNIVCNNCAQCDAHTFWTDITVLWIGFCLTGPISLCLDSFLHVLLYTVCMCRFVTWWGGPGGIEAYP